MALDDLQRADDASLRLLEQLAPRLTTGAVVAIGIHPPGPVGSSTLSALAREHAVVALAGFTIQETARFVESAYGMVPRESLVRDLQERSGGNPLFLDALLQVDAVEQALGEAAESSASTPDLRHRLVDSIARHVDDLPSFTRILLVQAAFLGREFELADLAVVEGRPLEDVSLGLGPALVARLVEPLREGRHQFYPPLVRDVLYGRVRGEERVARHQRIAETLDRHHEGRSSQHAAMLARQYAKALPRADAKRALDLAILAATQDVAAGDHARAVKHWKWAAKALTYVGGERHRRVEVQLGLGRAHARVGQQGAAREAFRSAIVLARSLQVPTALVEAATALARLAESDEDRSLASALLVRYE
jgi:predicted ATPase